MQEGYTPSPLSIPEEIQPWLDNYGYNTTGNTTPTIATASASIKQNEGFSATPYEDETGLTIGNGTRITGSNAPQAKKDFKDLGIDYDAVLSGALAITPTQADVLANKGIQRAEAAAKRAVSSYEAQPVEVQAVVTELAYQLGPTGLSKFKETIKAINNEDYDKAAEELLDSKLAQQAPERTKKLANKLKQAVPKEGLEYQWQPPQTGILNNSKKEQNLQTLIEEADPEDEGWFNSTVDYLSNIYDTTTETIGDAYDDASFIADGLLSTDEAVRDDAANYVKNKIAKSASIGEEEFEYNIDKEKEKAPEKKLKAGESIPFTKIAEIVSKADGRPYMSFRRQADNSEGLIYIPVPRKEKWKGYKQKGKDKMGYKIGMGGTHTTTGVEGIAHFLIDADISGKNKEQFHNTKNSIDRAKASKDQWIPVYKKNGDGSVTVKYAEGGDEYKAMENQGFTDFAVLRQLKASEVDWESMKRPKGFGPAVRNYTTKKGKDTFILFRDPANKEKKGKDAMGQFEGNSLVFLFKDPSGRAIIREYAGSANGIERELAEIKKNYSVKDTDITLGFYDAGSYSAKPVSQNGVLSSRSYGDFNNQSVSGAALAIPTKQKLQQLKKAQAEKQKELDDFNIAHPYQWDL